MLAARVPETRERHSHFSSWKVSFVPDVGVLPWSSETAIRPVLSPAQVFDAVMGQASSLDTEWHRQNGDEEIVHEPWRHPAGADGGQWGGQRACTMWIKAGKLGRQRYREDQRYTFTGGTGADGGGERLLVWHRSGGMANPPVVVPKFRVECAHIFCWTDGRLTCLTRSGLTGYNGWLRARIEGDCRRDFEERTLPCFEALLKLTLSAATGAQEVSHKQKLQATQEARERHRQRLGSADDDWGSYSTCFRSCMSQFIIDPHMPDDAPASAAVIVLPEVPPEVPGDEGLVCLDVGTLAALAQQAGVADAAEEDAFREKLKSGIAKFAATNPSANTRNTSRVITPAPPRRMSGHASAGGAGSPPVELADPRPAPGAADRGGGGGGERTSPPVAYAAPVSPVAPSPAAPPEACPAALPPTAQPRPPSAQPPPLPPALGGSRGGSRADSTEQRSPPGQSYVSIGADSRRSSKGIRSPPGCPSPDDGAEAGDGKRPAGAPGLNPVLPGSPPPGSPGFQSATPTFDATVRSGGPTSIADGVTANESTLDPEAGRVMLVSFSEQLVPHEAMLDRMGTGQLVDVVDRIGVCTADVREFRGRLTEALRAHRDAVQLHTPRAPGRVTFANKDGGSLVPPSPAADPLPGCRAAAASARPPRAVRSQQGGGMGCCGGC